MKTAEDLFTQAEAVRQQALELQKRANEMQALSAAILVEARRKEDEPPPWWAEWTDGNFYITPENRGNRLIRWRIMAHGGGYLGGFSVSTLGDEGAIYAVKTAYGILRRAVG